MSSDNGIYILETRVAESERREYRVAHILAVENLYYDVGTDECRREFIPQEAFRCFGECEIFSDEREALIRASQMADEHLVLEYGVSFLSHPTQVFQTFSDEELEFYDAEVEAAIARYREKREQELKAKREAANIRLPAGTKVCPGFCHGVLFITPEGEEIRGTLQLPEVTLREDTDFLPNGWEK